MVWERPEAKTERPSVDCLRNYDLTRYWAPECPGAPPRAPHGSLPGRGAAPGTGEWGEWSEDWAGPYPATDREYSDFIGCAGGYAYTRRCGGKPRGAPGESGTPQEPGPVEQDPTAARGSLPGPLATFGAGAPTGNLWPIALLTVAVLAAAWLLTEE